MSAILILSPFVIKKQKKQPMLHEKVLFINKEQNGNTLTKEKKGGTNEGFCGFYKYTNRSHWVLGMKDLFKA